MLRLLLPVFHFGTLAPLALLGIWTTWDRRQRLGPLYWLLAVYPLSVVLFYVFGRYRYPVVGLLALFAGAGLVEAARFFRAASAGRRLVAALTVAAALVACNWPTDSEARARASTLYNIGVWLGRQPERSSEAIALGLALGRDGRVSEAVGSLRTAIGIRPGSAPLHYNLGTVLAENGRMEEAVEEYRRAIELDPSDPRAHNNLGYALAALGRLDEAAAACSEALRLDPDYTAARTNLAAIEAAVTASPR